MIQYMPVIFHIKVALILPFRLTVVRLGLVAIVLDPPHRPVSYGFTLEVESDGEQRKEGHDAGIHAVGFHVAELGGRRNEARWKGQHGV